MSKQIKALKCSQCGSVKKQKVKEDHYVCNNCGTEYFLDSLDQAQIIFGLNTPFFVANCPYCDERSMVSLNIYYTKFYPVVTIVLTMNHWAKTTWLRIIK